jgi:uncharacterized protein (DUF2267 family)
MRRARGGVVVLATLAGGAVLLRPGTHLNHLARRELVRTARRLRYLEGRIEGVSYRLGGRHPDPDVVDNVLADRVRSSLGRIEHQLDLPHLHVMVERHVVLLHGEVDSEDQAEQLERAVAAVSGVSGVVSYLHVGLTPGDTRPSEGKATPRPPSAALQKLLAAAEGAGVDATTAPRVVRGVLATFADRLPPEQRDHVVTHLPADVRPLLTPPRRIAGARPPRTVHDLVGRIVGTTPAIPADRAAAITTAVLGSLRSLVPGDAGSVGASLPPELRELWDDVGPA